MDEDIKITLNISGKSFYEIADKLTKIAGDLLMVRILQKGEPGPDELPMGLVFPQKKDPT